MIVLRRGERLRRRYPARMKKDGDGTLYITSRRMCFETDRKGLCFDLDYDYVSNWSCDDRSLTVGWQDEHRNTHDLVTHEPDSHSRVRFRGRKADGSRLTMLEVHYSLFYAYTDHWRHGMRGLGYYADQAGRLWNHWDACHAEQKPVTPTPDGLMIKKLAMEAQARQILADGLGGTVIDASGPMAGMSLEEQDAYMEEHMPDGFDPLRVSGGRLLLEQDIVDRLVTFEAYGRDVSHDLDNGLPEKKYMAQDHATYCIKSSHDGIIVTGTNLVEEFKARIKKMEEENSTGELTKIHPAGKEVGSAHRPIGSGTIYDGLKYEKQRLAMELRARDIVLKRISEGVHMTTGEHKRYWREIIGQMYTWADKGGRIEDFEPGAEIAEPQVPLVANTMSKHRSLIAEAT